MERLSELINSLKERLSSPLIFSFLISWLVFNWKISVGLLWLSSTEIHDMGYKSVFDLISKETEHSSSFWWPILFAVVYTPAAPLFRNIVNALNAWMTKWGNKWFFSISKESSISTSRYLKLREKHEKLSLELKQVIDKESEYMVQNQQQRDTINQLEMDKRLLTEDKMVLDAMFHEDFLNGSWQLDYLTLPAQAFVLRITVQTSPIRKLMLHL